ncbi:hypothetical protein X975_20677, partial [Stegodyphus mimosarum]
MINLMIPDKGFQRCHAIPESSNSSLCKEKLLICFS